MSRIFVFGVAVAALLAATPPRPVRAFTFTYDKLAFLTFSGPVQIPGVTLQAGTYRFSLANAETSRNVLHVLSNDGSVVYAMFHTRPEWRVRTTEETVLTFRETPAGVPVAARTLFYPGEHRGYEFVYGKGEPTMTAVTVPQSPIRYTANPLPIDRPELEVFTEPMPVEHPAEEPLEATVQPVTPEVEPVAAAPAELPKTASPLPLVAVGGLTSLLVGLGLLRRRVN